jgi:hypothetical protein
MAVAAGTLSADFTYQETSTITGGMIAGVMKVAGVFSKQAREPIESTVSVKGDKMVRKTATHVSLIDLGSQTITTIDLQKKTYSVMTFDEMKQALEQMRQKMQQKQDPNKGQMSFQVSAKNTGNAKQVGGFDAKELILTMKMVGADQSTGQQGGMVITTDMWLAPAISGYGEVRDFQKRMAEKLNWAPGGNLFMNRPDVADGMAEVNKEIGKLDGMPVLTFVTMGAEGTAPPPSGDTSQQPAAQQQQQQQQEKPSVGGALGGALGGRFGLGRKKKPADDSASQPSSSSGQTSGQSGQPASTPGSLLEMKTELSSFSSNAVGAEQFSIPAGFKKVEPDMRRMQ